MSDADVPATPSAAPSVHADGDDDDAIAEPIAVVAIDDDQSLLDMTATFLERERADFDLTTETDPAAVLDAVERGRPDVVVSDYDMPEMNGLELLDAVRAIDDTIPFILFTGKDADAVAADALSRGASDYLQKGQGSSQYALLANRIRTVVEGRRARRRSRELEERTERLRDAQRLASELESARRAAEVSIERYRETGEEGRLDAAAFALDRLGTMLDLVESFGADTAVESTRDVELATLARRAWSMRETPDAELHVHASRLVEVDPSLAQRALEALVENSVVHGGDDVTVSVGATTSGFYVEDDGPGIPPEERGRVFESGHTSDPERAGLGLTVVAHVARAHDWDVTLTESDGGGLRVEFDGVTFRPRVY